MIGALLAIAIAGHHYSPLLLPKADLTAVVAPNCDLHMGPCVATWPNGGRLELSMTPRPIPFLQPLRIEVAVSGVTPAKVEVDFAGESSLPVCVSGSMDWVATVIVDAPGQRIVVPYRFTTGR